MSSAAIFLYLKPFIEGAPLVSAWLILATLGFALSRTHGTYSVEFLSLVLTTTLGFIVLSTKNLKSSDKLTSFLLYGSLCFFLGRLWEHSTLEYALPHRIQPLAPLIMGLSILSLFAFLILKKTFFLVFLFAFLSFFLILVPYFSPEPHIDVFPITKSAIEHFLKGGNPYTIEYPDQWSKAYGYKPGFSYPPLPLILGSVFYKLFGDFRALYSTCLIFSAGLIVVFKEALCLDSKRAWALGSLWLAFPINPLIIEQAWVDPLLIVTSMGLGITLTQSHIRSAALLMGLHFATKQYAILTFLFTLLWLISKKRFRDARVFAFCSIFIGICICLPFLVSAPSAFLQMVGMDVMAVAPRSDAFTVFALFSNVWGQQLPDWITPFVLVACLSFFAYFWNQKEPSLSSWAFSLFISTVLVFFFSRRAFANYYHFSVSFLILYLVTLAREKTNLKTTEEIDELIREV